MYVTIREKVEAEKTVTYVKKPALTMMQCDACGKKFHMVKLHNDHRPGVMRGIFDRMASDKGNMFEFHICSLVCANRLSEGHWKTLPEWSDFAQIEAEIQRATVDVSQVLSEQQMIQAWDKYKQTESSGYLLLGTYSFQDMMANNVISSLK